MSLLTVLPNSDTKIHMHFRVYWAVVQCFVVCSSQTKIFSRSSAHRPETVVGILVSLEKFVFAKPTTLQNVLSKLTLQIVLVTWILDILKLGCRSRECFRKTSSCTVCEPCICLSRARTPHTENTIRPFAAFRVDYSEIAVLIFHIQSESNFSPSFFLIFT